MAEKACEGGRVLDNGNMAECAECGTAVWWNLQHDSFWGFEATCPARSAKRVAREAEPPDAD